MTASNNEPTTTQPARHGQRAAEAPDSPTDLGKGSWLAAGKRSVSEFKNDFLQDRAAALTYYGIQAIFPALLVLVSLLGLLGKSATHPLTTNLTAAASAGPSGPVPPTGVHTVIGHDPGTAASRCPLERHPCAWI